MHDDFDHQCKPVSITDEQAAAIEMYRRAQLENDGESVSVDAALREQYRDAAREAMAEFQERFITPLIEMRMLPTDCLVFCNNYGYLIGCYSQKDIVKRHKQDPNAKANVSKYVKQYTRRLKLPALNGQRDEESCLAMKEARQKQLTHTPTPTHEH